MRIETFREAPKLTRAVAGLAVGDRAVQKVVVMARNQVAGGQELALLGSPITLA